MPHTTENEIKDVLPTSRSQKIAAWWRKFHFSGRVIMCSVLLGLGLILIGGLLFAINVDDDTDSSKSDYDKPQVSTKAPSHFTGPVLMGIGGFIVIMGVIMCLFETQVCRKRTGDASPLISEKADDSEKRDSEPTAVPSTSHAHKSHRHGARRTSASPRKSKNRHGKSHSKERNSEKNSSSKSPPIPVEPSKNFLTSSEENFLTPPNTLQEKASMMKNHETPSVDDKDSSLMKSFTSSGPSWNQSSEFLTPSSSFRGTPISLNNSVEIEKSQEDSNFKTTQLSENQNVNSEYMIPLTVEEDRIQQLLIRVKNEQKQMADSEKTNFEPTVHLKSEKNLSSSHDLKENVNKENEEIKKFDKEIKSSNELVSETHQDLSALKNTNQGQDIQIENEKENEKIEPNASERNHKVVNNVVVTEILNEVTNAEKEKKIFQLDKQQAEISPQISSTSETNDLHLVPSIEKGISDDIVESNNEQVDLESSVSSVETVVSPDSIQDNRDSKEATTEDSPLPISKANLNDESNCVPTLESPPLDTTVVINNNIDHRNIDEDATNEEAGAHDLNLNSNSNVETAANDVENASTLKIS